MAQSMEIGESGACGLDKPESYAARWHKKHGTNPPLRRLLSEPSKFPDSGLEEVKSYHSRSSSTTFPSLLKAEDINFDIPFDSKGVTATLFNHRSFREPSEKIEPVHIQSPFIRTLIEFLKEKCMEHKFIAASANQFGVNLDLFIYKVPAKEIAGEAYEHLYGDGEEARDWQVCINSSWTPHRDSQEFVSKEGSFARRSSLDEELSAPVEVKRYDKIIASWTNDHGEVITTKLPKFAGNVFQNKVDYNKGLTPVDRYSSLGKSSDPDLYFDSQESAPPEIVGRYPMEHFDTDML